ncbi:MAG: hypothetical protein Q4E26_10365 [Prevotellaceae bacterium]|nr:hypothetical protein [Prevotellaceae bacterium]
MKKYITPTLTVEEILVTELMIFCSEISTEITDGGAAKESFGVWVDEDEDEE